MAIRRVIRRIALLLAVLMICVAYPARADDAQAIEITRFDRHSAVGCAGNRPMGQDLLFGRLGSCQSLPPFTQGTATSRQAADDTGTLTFDDAVSGGSVLERWIAASYITYDAGITTSGDLSSVDLVVTYRLDRASATGSGGGDVSVYGTITGTTGSARPQRPLQADPACADGRDIQPSGIGAIIWDTTPAGVHDVRITYTCPNSRIQAQETFGMNVLLIGMVESHSERGTGHALFDGQLLSATWVLHS